MEDLFGGIFSISFFFTARVRSTREGNVLTRVCPSICLSTGGVRSSQGGGGQVKGQSSREGGSGQRSIQPGGSGQRSIQLGGSGQRSIQPRGGGCQVKGQSSREGQVKGQSSRGWGGHQVQPGGGQHLAPSCGRYASCVHAGGLSCGLFFCFPPLRFCTQTPSENLGSPSLLASFQMT